MITIISYLVVAVVAFVAGVLVGKKNAAKVATVVNTATAVAADAKSAIDALKK